jgi:outer membrane protein TolC
LRLSVNDAVAMALEHNTDLRVDRLDPGISEARVAAALGAFRPFVNGGIQRSNQLQPPTSFLIPIPTRTDVVTTSAGVGQRLSWFGTSYNVAWNATHTNSDSVLNSFNPLVQSGLSVSVSQPLLRDLFIDQSRQQLAASRVARDIADTRLRESLVHLTANVKTTYWNLVSAVATVEARQSALDLARELVRVNTAKVNVGQSPALDLVSAQAEVASDEEQLIIARTAVQQNEDRLRLLIYDPVQPEMWTVPIVPVDAPPIATVTPDVNAAVMTALKERADLQRARKDIETAAINTRFAANTRLPDVRLNGSYLASGLGGTQVLRTGGFPGTVVGSGAVTDFASVLSQVFARDYPTWSFGVSVSYPIGQSTEDANYARSRLEEAQSAGRLKSAEAKAVSQVRDAAWKIEMNAQRIRTTRAARELAEQRLDAERKRYDVGMSTSFLTIQAQRDLAQAKTNELAAVLAYDLSLVDFEALQEAGPASSSGTGQPQSQGQGGAPATTSGGTQ